MVTRKVWLMNKDIKGAMDAAGIDMSDPEDVELAVHALTLAMVVAAAATPEEDHALVLFMVGAMTELTHTFDGQFPVTERFLKAMTEARKNFTEQDAIEVLERFVMALDEKEINWEDEE